MDSTAGPNVTNRNKKVRFTPRQLIKYHMEHPEIPITDEDIENLIFDFPEGRPWRKNNTSFQQSNNNQSHK